MLVGLVNNGDEFIVRSDLSRRRIIWKSYDGHHSPIVCPELMPLLIGSVWLQATSVAPPYSLYYALQYKPTGFMLLQVRLAEVGRYELRVSTACGDIQMICSIDGASFDASDTSGKRDVSYSYVITFVNVLPTSQCSLTSRVCGLVCQSRFTEGQGH